MVWSIMYHLICDGKSDFDPEHECSIMTEGALSKDEAIADARSKGWVVLTRKHYCKNCKMKQKNAKTRR